MKVKCVSLEGECVAGLTLDKVYDLIELDNGMIRIINDYQEPPLYDSDLFHLEDATVVGEWTIEVDEYCGVYYGPIEFYHRGFWERVWEKKLPEFNIYLKWMENQNILFKGWKTGPRYTVKNFDKKAISED